MRRFAAFSSLVLLSGVAGLVSSSCGTSQSDGAAGGSSVASAGSSSSAGHPGESVGGSASGASSAGHAGAAGKSGAAGSSGANGASGATGHAGAAANAGASGSSSGQGAGGGTDAGGSNAQAGTDDGPGGSQGGANGGSSMSGMGGEPSSQGAGGGPLPTGCFPQGSPPGDGGGTCASLHEAWTARGINTGYYPFKVLQDLPQYSGDFSGDPSTTFTSGAASKGVILQVIHAGSYVGLSSIPTNYSGSTTCYPGASGCGSSDGACATDSPNLRQGVSANGVTYVWGYGYGSASHMQGWIAYDPNALEFAGFDASHPCANGPAGADFEVKSACGMPTSCKGASPTCGAVNPCTEGSDDCGATKCGAMSGGALTPSAWKKTITLPANDHMCSQSVPNPAVRCLANGSDQDFFLVYPFGAYLYWAQNSTTKAWLHYGDDVQAYFHTRDAQGVLWDFVEVTTSGAPVLTAASDGSGAPSSCTSSDTTTCTPCKNGGTCGWIQDVFVQ